MIGRIWNWLRWRRQSRKFVSELINAVRRGAAGSEPAQARLRECRVRKGSSIFEFSESSLNNELVSVDDTFVQLPRGQSRRLRNFLRARSIIGARAILRG